MSESSTREAADTAREPRERLRILIAKWFDQDDVAVYAALLDAAERADKADLCVAANQLLRRNAEAKADTLETFVREARENVDYWSPDTLVVKIDAILAATGGAADRPKGYTVTTRYTAAPQSPGPDPDVGGTEETG